MQKITNFDDNDYQRYALIKPPSDYKGDNEKYTRIIIDSKNRDINLFPNPNSYELNFDDEFIDLISAQLIYMNMPFTNYLINKYFNTLNITYNNINYTVILTNGNYADDKFLLHVQAQLDSVIGSGLITISYITATDSYSFTANSASFSFNFIGHVNNLAMLLGFNNNKNYTASGSGPYVLTAPYRRNFNYNNYIIMDIEQFDILKSPDKDLNKSFAIIPQNYINLNLYDNANYIKKFSPPIPRLTKLYVKIYDRFGNPYDFQNQDHHFELLLSSYKQKRKYTNIFAN